MEPWESRHGLWCFDMLWNVKRQCNRCCLSLCFGALDLWVGLREVCPGSLGLFAWQPPGLMVWRLCWQKDSNWLSFQSPICWSIQRAQGRTRTEKEHETVHVHDGNFWTHSGKISESFSSPFQWNDFSISWCTFLPCHPGLFFLHFLTRPGIDFKFFPESGGSVTKLGGRLAALRVLFQYLGVDFQNNHCDFDMVSLWFTLMIILMIVSPPSRFFLVIFLYDLLAISSWFPCNQCSPCTRASDREVENEGTPAEFQFIPW